jgi:Zn-dependent peptidase ImmA (M78 family)
MLHLKLPYLRPIELDGAAAELLRRYARWKGATPRPPIDIDDIVEGYLKLQLAVVDLQAQLGAADVLGATWFDEGRVAVDRSLEGQDGRFAFTLAHEVGHWMLHRPLYEADKVTRPRFTPDGVAAAPPEPAIVCRSSQQQAAAEWQANQFAARLLMPSSHVCAAVQALCGRARQVWGGLRRALAGGGVDARLRSLAAAVIDRGRFENVSNEAMRRRLIDLKLVVDRAELRAV